MFVSHLGKNCIIRFIEVRSTSLSEIKRFLRTTSDLYDTDKMASEFLQQHADHALSIGQWVCF